VIDRRPKSAFLFLIFACWVTVTAALAQTDHQIYTDSLQNNWVDWSWDCASDFNSTSVVHSGATAIGVTLTAGWGAFSLHHNDMDSSPYTSITFWINGGPTGGERLQLAALLGDVNGGTVSGTMNLGALPTNAWQQVTVSLAALGAANQPNLTRFWFQDQTGGAQPVFYLDDLKLVASSTPPVTNTPVSIAVDAQLNRHPISPLIYGVAFASSNQLADLNFALNRSGGNSMTRANWQLNAQNHADDWYFESLDDFNGGDPRAAVPGATADEFVANSRNGGGDAMLTIPMIGWMPKLGAGRARLASYATTNYGPQTDTDWQWFPVAGNGVGTNAAAHSSWLITTNNPNDANFATNSVFQQAFIQHLTNRWGMSTNGGVRYYLMDNEETIWHSTHRDVHPVGTTMQEIRDKFYDYAGVVKALDPNALVLAPEEWGWGGYFYSGYDQQNAGNRDRGTNGGWDYCPWLLNQFYQRATNTNQRLLDYFTLHCYPQGGEALSTDVSTSMQLLRNRSTRQLWDTNYVDASWIGQQPANNILMLIPRMKGWVTSYYPGTKTGITEYNWGAEGYINGATAQADVLGILGREGLDLATRWTAVEVTNIVHKAMKLYRNYDGNKSTFGDTSVSATGPNPDNVSTFAAVRSSDGALTVMVINKQIAVSATASFVINNFLLRGTAQVWQLTAANTITRLSDLSFAGTSFTNTVPAQSITLLVLPAAIPCPSIKAQPQNCIRGPGGAATIQVTATNATGYQWRLGGKDINGQTSAALNLTNIKMDDFGTYTVLVTGDCGSILSNPAQLILAAQPSATSPSLNLSTFSVTFTTETGPVYTVECKNDLGDPIWQFVANVTGTGVPITITDNTSSNASRFYRIHVQ
jgi:hypothetical protein